MSFTLRINPYIAIPETIKVSENEMDIIVNTFPEICAVMWVAGKKIHEVTNHVDDNEHRNKKSRKTFISFIWNKTFYCHRRGQKDHSKVTPGGKSGLTRP